MPLADDRGAEHQLDAAAWCRDDLPGDAGLVHRCTGPTLDVGCGRAFGAQCIAVATGRHTVDDLTACAADHVFRDLSDTARVVTAILDGETPPTR